jgi:hypothetical protein
VRSITEELDSLVCLERESIPMTHLFELDPRTKERKKAVDIAMRVAHRWPECNHIEFLN